MPTYRKDNPESIQSMFASIASRYDLANKVLSFNMHRFWNSQLIHEITDRHNPESLLDLCCGTGDIALTFLKQAKTPKTIHMLDFCPEMLEGAKAKTKPTDVLKHHISFITADAQVIPLADDSVVCATVAYGIRNVKSPEKCIKDVFRVLKPGGGFAILELTEPNNKFLRFGHRLYLKTVLPTLGKLLTSNEDAYGYLCNSIKEFVKPADLEQMLKETGFVHTMRRPLLGGIATIMYGKKPIIPFKPYSEMHSEI